MKKKTAKKLKTWLSSYYVECELMINENVVPASQVDEWVDQHLYDLQDKLREFMAERMH